MSNSAAASNSSVGRDFPLFYKSQLPPGLLKKVFLFGSAKINLHRREKYPAGGPLFFRVLCDLSSPPPSEPAPTLCDCFIPFDQPSPLFSFEVLFSFSAGLKLHSYYISSPASSKRHHQHQHELSLCFYASHLDYHSTVLSQYTTLLLDSYHHHPVNRS